MWSYFNFTILLSRFWFPEFVITFEIPDVCLFFIEHRLFAITVDLDSILWFINLDHDNMLTISFFLESPIHEE